MWWGRGDLNHPSPAGEGRSPSVWTTAPESLQQRQRRQQPLELLSRCRRTADRHELPRVLAVAFENGAVTHARGLESLPEIPERGLVGAGERHRMKVLDDRAVTRFVGGMLDVRPDQTERKIPPHNDVVGEGIAGRSSLSGAATGEGVRSGLSGNGLSCS